MLCTLSQIGAMHLCAVPLAVAVARSDWHYTPLCSSFGSGRTTKIASYGPAHSVTSILVDMVHDGQLCVLVQNLPN